MACPFFYPTGQLNEPYWPHPRRLPLGSGFVGICRAQAREEFRPSEFAMLDCCNLGYARGACPRFPADGAADAVRFAVAGDEPGLIVIQYVVEKDYLPHEHGTLEFDRNRGAFRAAPEDPTLARQAQVYLENYVRRRYDASAQACAGIAV